TRRRCGSVFPRSGVSARSARRWRSGVPPRPGPRQRAGWRVRALRGPAHPAGPGSHRAAVWACKASRGFGAGDGERWFTIPRAGFARNRPALPVIGADLIVAHRPIGRVAAEGSGIRKNSAAALGILANSATLFREAL